MKMNLTASKCWLKALKKETNAEECAYVFLSLSKEPMQTKICHELVFVVILDSMCIIRSHNQKDRIVSLYT